MEISSVITPIAIILELVIFIMGLHLGYILKKTYGYLFAFTFLVFALFDYLDLPKINDNLSVPIVAGILMGLVAWGFGLL